MKHQLDNQIFSHKPEPANTPSPFSERNLCTEPQSWLSDGRYVALIVAITVTYVIFGTGFLIARSPHGDEGIFGNAAFLFLTKGYLAMPTVESAGYPWLQGLDRYVYWNMPLYMIFLAGWFKMFGVSLFSMRAMSLVCGLGVAFSWLLIVKALFRNKTVALLCFAVVALNYDVLNVATNGRTDMMAVALYSGGMAAYLSLREWSHNWAILASHTLVAASFMTHPYGAFGFLAVVLFMVVLERRRLRTFQLLLAAVPYLLAGSCWVAYAMLAPELAKAQLLGNIAAGRINGLSAPLLTLWREIWERYLVLFAGWRSGVPLAMRLRVFVLLVYLGSFLILVLSSPARRRRAYSLLLTLMAADFVLLTYFENLKWYVYLIHIVPVYSAVFGVCVYWCWAYKQVPRALLGAAVVGFVLFQLCSVGYRVRLNSYRHAFAPAARFLKQSVRPGDVVMASSEFAYVLGFDGRVVDDYRLGYYSGKVPSFIVVEKMYQGWFDFFPKDSAVHRHVARYLESERKLLFEVSHGGDYYRIYGPPERSLLSRDAVRTY